MAQTRTLLTGTADETQARTAELTQDVMNISPRNGQGIDRNRCWFLSGYFCVPGHSRYGKHSGNRNEGGNRRSGGNRGHGERTGCRYEGIR